MDTKKDLVKRAIEFRCPERIPLVFRGIPEESDMVDVGYEPPKGWKAKRQNEDEWGCIWDNLINTGKGQVVWHPISNWQNFDKYQFPDPRAEGRFDKVKEVIEKYGNRYLAGGLGITGFNKMFLMRGFENLLNDMCLEEDRFNRLADKVFGFEMEIIEEYSKFEIDGIMFFDDWGTQDALIVNPKMWRRLFKPRYREQFNLVHKKDMHVIFHSCGYVWDIIPDMIEIGVDVLNLEQPLIFGKDKADGIDRLAQEFGGKVCFLSNVDSQRTLITGTKEEIIGEAKHLIAALGKYKGGFIALANCTQSHGYVPIERIHIMSEAFRRYGDKR